MTAAILRLDRRFVRPCLLCCLWLSSCSNAPAPVAIPEISPRDAAERALAAYDTNKDGKLDARELEKCPAFLGRRQLIDKDNDGSLSASEIEEHLVKYQRGQSGLFGLMIRVEMDDQPLPGASVTMTPEEFMGGNVKPAKGITDQNGMAEMRAEGANLPGCHFGFYKIQVSKTDAGGKELVPARYNTRTGLGHEVGPDSRSSTEVLRLSSR